jgi:hypothetical protein
MIRVYVEGGRRGQEAGREEERVETYDNARELYHTGDVRHSVYIQSETRRGHVVGIDESRDSVRLGVAVCSHLYDDLFYLHLACSLD